MNDLLSIFVISTRGIKIFMNEEDCETIHDLAISTDKGLQSTIRNVNKFFGSASGSIRIYFPPNEVSNLRELCIYFYIYISYDKPNPRHSIHYGR